MSVIVGYKYKHYKNNKIYVVVDFCKIQVNSEWKKAILYKSENPYIKDLFCREYKEFKEKFEKVEK